jgi:threonylcarbamoyladenosine tRNA methylthiotransferase MtaB
LPAQSGDPDTLRAMRRGHGVDELHEVTASLARQIPGMAIGTDIIVGFPGESEAAFERTMELVERIPIAYAHVFSYSIRAGTEAATMPHQVDAAAKSRRSEALRRLSDRKWRSFRERLLGAELDVVAHRRRHPRTGALVGLSSENVKVELDGDDAYLGRRVRVRLERLDGARSLGRILG